MRKIAYALLVILVLVSLVLDVFIVVQLYRAWQAAQRLTAQAGNRGTPAATTSVAAQKAGVLGKTRHTSAFRRQALSATAAVI